MLGKIYPPGGKSRNSALIEITTIRREKRGRSFGFQPGVLDELTSAFDSDAEAALYRAIAAHLASFA